YAAMRRAVRPLAAGASRVNQRVLVAVYLGRAVGGAAPANSGCGAEVLCPRCGATPAASDRVRASGLLDARGARFGPAVEMVSAFRRTEPPGLRAVRGARTAARVFWALARRAPGPASASAPCDASDPARSAGPRDSARAYATRTGTAPAARTGAPARPATGCI